MATYYINPSSGNDANDGTSFANAWKTVTNGATAVRIAPGDIIRIMESPRGAGTTAVWKSQNSNERLAGEITGATNASPIVVTSAGHGLQNGNTVGISGVQGNTNANGVWEISSVTTDTFTLVGSAGNSAYTTGGDFFDISNAVVKYTTPFSQDISFCGNNGQAICGNWTASANVTSTVNVFDIGIESYIREGNCSLKLELSSSFSTGKAAYKQISGGPLNLSAYNGITFQIAKADAAIAANEYKIVLCSDNAGTTIVDEFIVPESLSFNTMMPFTVNRTGGGTLGSSIASIALYKITSDSVAKTIYIDNIVAVKNNYPSLISVLSFAKNNGDFTDYYGIMSIRDNKVILNNGPVSIACDPSNPPIGFYDIDGDGSSGFTTNSIDPFYIDSLPSSSPLCLVNESGTVGNLITFVGGYNSSDMTNISGKTIFASRSGYNSVFSSNSKEYLELNNIQTTRAQVGFELYACNNSVITDCCATNMADTGIAISGCSNSTFNSTYTAYPKTASAVISAGFCMQNGILISGDSNYNTFNGLRALSCSYNVKYCNVINELNGLVSCNGVHGFDMYSETTNTQLNLILNNTTLSANSIGLRFESSSTFGATINTISIYDSGIAVLIGNENKGIVIDNLVTSGNSSGINMTYASATVNSGRIGYPVAETTPFTIVSSDIYLNRVSGLNYYDPIGNQSNGDPSIAYVTDCVDSTDAVFSGSYGPYSSSFVTSAPVHGSTTKSWQMNVGNGAFPWNKTADSPLILPIAKIAVQANVTVSVSAWFRREDLAIEASLVLPGNQLIGVELQVSDAMTAAINTWEQLSISFTPYIDGVVEIQAQAYGSTANAVYVGDMSVSTSTPSIAQAGYYIGGSCDGGYSNYASSLIYGTETVVDVPSMSEYMSSNTSSGVNTTTHGYAPKGDTGAIFVLRFNYVGQYNSTVSTAILSGPLYAVSNTSSTSGYFNGGLVYVIGAGNVTSLARWKMGLATQVSYQLSNISSGTSNSGGAQSTTHGYIPSGAGIMKFLFSTDVVSTLAVALTNVDVAGISATSSAFFCAGNSSVCSNSCQELVFSTDGLNTIGATTSSAAGNMASSWNTSNGYLYGGSCYDGSGKIPRTDCTTAINKLNLTSKTISTLSATTIDSRGYRLGLNCG